MKSVSRYLSWFSGLLFLWSIFGLQFLGFTPDNRVLMDPSDPRVVDLSQFEENFSAQNYIGIVVSCSDGGAECRSGLPEVVLEIHRLAYKIPYVVRVDSLVNHPVVRSDDFSIDRLDFLEEFCRGGCPPGLFESGQISSIYRLVSADGDTMAVFSALRFDTSNTGAVLEIHQSLQSIEDLVTLPEGASLHFVGRVPLMYAFVEASMNEVYGFMGLAILLISLLLYVAFGDLRMALTSLGLSIATILTTLGIGGWFGLVLSTGSAALATVILTLTTAMAMHYFMHIVRVLSEDQTRDQKQIAYGAAEAQLIPILLTAATTILAMLSMLFVESPPFRDLGVWTAVSLPICCLYLFSVVPNLVQRLPKISPSRWQIGLQPILNRYARGAGRSGSIAVLFGLLALIAAANISQLSLDDDFVRYFDPDTRFRSDAEHVAKHLIGPTNIEIEILSDGSIYEPSFLLRTSAFVEELREFPDIDNVYSIVDVLDFFGPHLVDQDWRQLDEDGIAQLVLVYELSLTDGQSKNDLISVDSSSIRVSAVGEDMSSRQIVLLSERISELAKSASLNILITGEAIPLSYLSEKNIPNIALSLLATILGTSAFLAVFFRNAWLGVILFVTTVVPIVCGFGVWAFYQDSIGIAATIVLCICTGVVIDDTIHMIYRFNHARKNLRLDVQEAISYMVHRVANAICTTTLILATGFGVLAFSPFEVNSTFGTVTALILVGALAIDLLVLPNLLSFAPEKKE